MKKVLASIVLGALLFSVASVALAAEPVPGGAQTPNSCCIIRHEMEFMAPDTVDLIKGTIVGPVGVTAEDCSIGAVALETPNWAAYCALDTVLTVSDWIFWLAFVIGAVIIVVGAIMFMTATGSPERSAKAKSVLVFGILGIVIAIIAKFIPGIAEFFMGM